MTNTGSWPPNFVELARQAQQDEMRSWLQPKSGDLIGDVTYLRSRFSKGSNPKTRGVYARATIVMAAATIEAITNDVLATIYDLLTDTIPSECAGEPPWCYFIGRSTKRIERLLRRGRFVDRRDYVLYQIERSTGGALGRSAIRNIDRVMRFRNRIVHMSFEAQPARFGPMLNTAQAVPIAALASDCARDYLDFVSSEFSDLELPIRTIRPYYWDFQGGNHSR